ncbi:MAG: hypothetical protein ABI054_04810, partial [Planctomycetota bacterium]
MESRPRTSPDRPLFHCAFPVHDLAATRAFYGDLLGCSEGRSAPRWWRSIRSEMASPPQIS